MSGKGRSRQDRSKDREAARREFLEELDKLDTRSLELARWMGVFVHDMDEGGLCYFLRGLSDKYGFPKRSVNDVARTYGITPWEGLLTVAEKGKLPLLRPRKRGEGGTTRTRFVEAVDAAEASEAAKGGAACFCYVVAEGTTFGHLTDLLPRYEASFGMKDIGAVARLLGIPQRK